MTTPAREPSPSRRYVRHGMLPQLVAFEAVVRLGSATHAAQMLCMAQPTLSGHLRKLSAALGVRLFDMKGRRLVPTDAALVLLQAAGAVFAAFADCERLLAGFRAGSHPSGMPQADTEGPERHQGAEWITQTKQRPREPLLDLHDSARNRSVDRFAP